MLASDPTRIARRDPNVRASLGPAGAALRHLEGRDDQFAAPVIGYRPTHDLATLQIRHQRQMQPPLGRGDRGDVL